MITSYVNNAGIEKPEKDYSVEIAFTKAYKKYCNDNIYMREAMCLKEQFPAILKDIQKEDLIAGRIVYRDVGFGTQTGSVGGYGYFFLPENIVGSLTLGEVKIEQRDQVHELLTYWRSRDTRNQVRAAFTPEMKAKLRGESEINPLDSAPAVPIFRIAGSFMNYDVLMKKGISGLEADILAQKEKVECGSDSYQLYEAMLENLKLFRCCCDHYITQAQKLISECDCEIRKGELERMIKALEGIKVHAPETFHEALQLFWLYSIMAGVINFGRMDIYLGDFYVNDIDSGKITEDDALKLLQSCWRLMTSLTSSYFDCRVIIGGAGRRNPENADRFAIAAMEASRTVHSHLPQLTLRMQEGMSEAVWQKAVQVISEGRTYPLLYNDDVNVEAVRKGYEIPLEDAEQYVPLGCGEYVIDHMSIDSPNGAMNLLKIVELAMHNGKDPVTGQQEGPETGDFESFTTFDQFYEAFMKQAVYFAELLADQEALQYNVVKQLHPWLYISMLYDGCIEKGKALLDGVKYLCGCLELYGNVVASDTLCAIKKTVFEDKRFTKKQLLEILDANFEGFESERKVLQACPKYGNDIEEADDMYTKMHSDVCKMIRGLKDRNGLYAYLAVIINNGQNVAYGRWCMASADGRKAGSALSNANSPTSGNDVSGVTAMLNSLAKPDHSIHAGMVQNMRFSKEFVTNDREKFESLIKGFFLNGGNQAMISVINRDDLKKALVEPEKYKDLFVRVGGFSARFIDLPRDLQFDIINRTTY